MHDFDNENICGPGIDMQKQENWTKKSMDLNITKENDSRL
jgi:hypothetical protein